jgi:hypothetical protein
MLYLKMNIKLLLRDYSLRRCIRNEYQKQHIYRVTLLLKEYTFIYLPHIEGSKGNLSIEYQTKASLFLDSYLSK